MSDPDSKLVQEGLFTQVPPQLLGVRCLACNHVSFPRTTWCPHCRSTELAPHALSTVGTVFSYTIVRVPVPGYAGPVPYGLGIVELPDGIRVNTVLIAEPLEALTVGAPVRTCLMAVGSAEQPVLSYGFELDPR